MTTIDFSPLFRSAIGFDRLARFVDSAQAAGNGTGFPPYDIARTAEDSYRLTLAVAGFAPEDLDITVKENTLIVTGRQAESGAKSEVLYRGIDARPFERRFALAEHIVVDGAEMRNGLLHVALKRVMPESLKPRRIAIASGTQTITADAKAA